jgi:FMN reductase
MSTVLLLSGSPSPDSRTGVLLAHTGSWLAERGHDVATLHVRELPTSALLVSNTEHPAIRAALSLVHRADGLIVASPVYRAAYSGLVKAFLDLLADNALARKVVLPLATGGTQGHLVAIDYALRPMLTAMGADRLVPGCFVLDRLIQPGEEGGAIEPDARAAVDRSLEGFDEALAEAAGRLAAAS